MSLSLTSKKGLHSIKQFCICLRFFYPVDSCRFQYKDEYEKFKFTLSTIAMIMSVINLFANLRYSRV